MELVLEGKGVMGVSKKRREELVRSSFAYQHDGTFGNFLSLLYFGTQKINEVSNYQKIFLK